MALLYQPMSLSTQRLNPLWTFYLSPPFDPLKRIPSKYYGQEAGGIMVEQQLPGGTKWGQPATNLALPGSKLRITYIFPNQMGNYYSSCSFSSFGFGRKNDAENPFFHLS